jgi:hypothetical protein
MKDSYFMSALHERAFDRIRRALVPVKNRGGGLALTFLINCGDYGDDV